MAGIVAGVVGMQAVSAAALWGESDKVDKVSERRSAGRKI
jgi:hypothetical protein